MVKAYFWKDELWKTEFKPTGSYKIVTTWDNTCDNVCMYFEHEDYRWVSEEDIWFESEEIFTCKKHMR